jgi:prepilin-type N-terminal cleavage/methylation domain-containing protein
LFVFSFVSVPTVLRGNPCPRLKSRRHAGMKHESGFTLLELLLVVTLLSVTAGIMMPGYEGVQDQGRYDTTRFEMAELRKALLQFRRDSGSNDFPGQGIYDCTALAEAAIDNGRPDTWPVPPSVPPVSDATNKSDWIAWCEHPANFWMLFVDPLGNGWDPDTRRGWNGPYLQRKSGYVDVGDNLQRSGIGNPAAGNVIVNLWGIASPYLSAPVGANSYLAWRPRPTVDADDYERNGTPYLLFDLDDDEQARIVSLGVDGIYESQDSPSCEQILDSEGLPRDDILCLLR